MIDLINILIGIVMSIAAMVVFFAITAKLVVGTENGVLEPLVRLTILPLFIITDWLYNWTIASIVFLHIPQRPMELVTERMKRYKLQYSNTTDLRWYESWRLNLSNYICKQLSVHDKGHC